MKPHILLLLLCMMPGMLQARAYFVPLLEEKEHESNKFGYHVVFETDGTENSMSIEINAVAASAVTGVRLIIRDEQKRNLDMKLENTRQKDGTIKISLIVAKEWMKESELLISSGYYSGANFSKNFAGYAIYFRNLPEK